MNRANPLTSSCEAMMYTSTRKALNSINSLLVAVLLLSLPTYNSAHAESLSKATIPLLERMGHEYATNRDRLRTWRGKVDFIQKVGKVGAEPLQEVDKAMIRFVYDGEKQRCLSVHEQTWAPEQTNELPGLLFRAAMLTNDGYYVYNSYSPEHFPSKFLPIVMIYTDAEGRKASGNKRTGDFRPLAMSTPGADVSGLMLGYAKLLKEGVVDLKDTTLSRTGNIVKVRNKLGDVVNEYVLDLDMGSSLVEFVSSGSDPSLVWKCKMEKVAGVFVPGILTLDEVRGNKRLIQEMRWFDQVVNEPTAEDEFTIANMGVHRGDWVHDTRTDAEYELTDTKIPGRTTPGIARELRETARRPSHLPHYSFLVGLFFLAVVVALLIYRRYRSAKARE